MKKSIHTHKLIVTCIVALCIFSCEDFVEIDLPNSRISDRTVFENDETAIAAATGMYNSMLETRNLIGGPFNQMSYLGGLSTDELVDLTGTTPYREFYENQININNSAVFSVWSGAYKTIYEANAVIEGVGTSTAITPGIRNQLQGEARFIRALYHFYLVNLFGDIPLVTSTDYRENANIVRTPVADVYVQIKTDLLEAKQLLTEEYFNGGKIRPNRWAAAALLSRVYLYERNYSAAETEASAVIGSPLYSLQTDLNKVFVANSAEAILELSQVFPYGFPTADGDTFYISSSFGSTKTVSPDFLNSFEPNDTRKTNWISSRVVNSVTYFRPFKYKVRVYFDDGNYPENLVLLRLAEQYLIRAEARTEQGDISGAQSDLNAIRNRAGLPDTGAGDQASLRLAIEQERKSEFFCEMGHRWFDLKRTSRADAVLGLLKTSWNATDVYYPIPEQEMLNNPTLTPQNDGY